MTYAYDGLKRLTEKSLSTGGTVTFAYTGQKLTQVMDTTIPTEYAYVRVRHVVPGDDEHQGSRGTVNYTYDLAGIRRRSRSRAGRPRRTPLPRREPEHDRVDAGAGEVHYAYRLTGQYQTMGFPNGQTEATGMTIRAGSCRSPT